MTIMSVRVYKIVIGFLLCIVLLLGWSYWRLSGQVVWTYFIDAQCRTTQESFIDASPDPRALALRLDFLMGYYLSLIHI